MLSRLKIRYRLWLLVAVCGAMLTAAAVYALVIQRDEMLSSHRAKTTAVLDVAYALLEQYGRLAASGTMPLAEAQKQAKLAIGQLRYDQANYFSILDTDRYMVWHPVKPELNGQDLSDLRDSNHVRIVDELVQSAQRGKGEFVDYLWPKPGDSRPVPKVATSRLYAPWNWVLQTGMYVDDVDAEFQRSAVVYGFSVFAAMLVLLAVSWRITHSIDLPLTALQTRASRIADQVAEKARTDAAPGTTGPIAAPDDGSVPAATAQAHDEIAHLATAFDVMTQRLMSANGELEAINDKLRFELIERQRIEEELHRHQDQLQELVEERTLDLVAAKESAERANRAKSEFLTNISHELRTPMHAILAFAQLGATRIDIAGRDKLLKFFQAISDSGQRMLKLVDGLLDMSRLQAGKVRLEFASCDLHDQAEAVIDELTPIAAQKGVHLQVERHDDDTRIECDGARIRQVIVNLVSNAIRFTSEGGEVRIGIGVDEHSEPPASSGIADLVLEVRDSGCGIPEDELEHIFGKFELSSITKNGAGGTGVGLSICRELVKLHGGTIKAHNNPDGGACFAVHLPRIRHAASPPPQPLPSPGGQTLNRKFSTSPSCTT